MILFVRLRDKHYVPEPTVIIDKQKPSTVVSDENINVQSKPEQIVIVNNGINVKVNNY